MTSRSHFSPASTARSRTGNIPSMDGSGKRKASTLSEVSTSGSTVYPGNSLSGPSKKRTIATAKYLAHDEEQDEVAAAEANAALAKIGSRSPRGRKRAKSGEPGEEKRLRVFRNHAPLSYLERLDRAHSQRMFLIDREQTLSEDGCKVEELFDIAGSTGNVYQVKVSKMPTCTCPDAMKGNQCKHIIYILVNVLKAPEHLAYQLAFLSFELATVFAAAPATPQSSQGASSEESKPGHRKAIEGDCPICVTEFSPETESIVWCKAACGNNIHKECFESWASSKPGQVKCVYCRTTWKGDEDTIKKISKMGKRNEEGYVNVASQLGLSIERDMSSYYQPRARRGNYG